MSEDRQRKANKRSREDSTSPVETVQGLIYSKSHYQDKLPDGAKDNIPIPDAIDDFEIVLNGEYDTVTLKNKNQRFQRLNLFYKKVADGRKLSLFCHDMKGNYLPEDLSNKHALDLTKDDPGYPFLFSIMNYTDVFVYFSHHGISVPPKRWINETHNHGKIVLGTILFEENSSLKVADILKCVKTSANKLAELMDHKYFDGYLINVEVKMNEEEVRKFRHFLKHLKKAIRNRIGFDAPLIWYDAVTVKGDLDWQNQLNEKNNIFYDICGFILTNYGWKDEELRNSERFATKGKNTVFFGIDMFGRNTTYPAGVNGCAMALEQLDVYRYSAGIFAPGHYRESCLSPKDDGLASVYNHWFPIIKYLHAEPFPFTNPIKISSPFNLWQKCNDKLFAEYNKYHRYILMGSEEEPPFYVSGTTLIFPKKGRFKLLSFYVDKPTMFMTMATCDNGFAIFKDGKGGVLGESVSDKKDSQLTIQIHKQLVVYFEASEDNAVIHYVHIF